MVLFASSAWVWLEHGEDAFIPVQMIRQAGEKIIAKASTNEQYELDVNKNYPEVHPSSLRAVENMVAMEELSEAAILHNLRLRFTDNLIYTHISSILVSINPFKQLPIYRSERTEADSASASKCQPANVWLTVPPCSPLSAQSCHHERVS